MQNEFSITLKVASDLQSVYDACIRIVQSNKMKVKKQEAFNDSFYLYASEKMSLLSFNWPTRIEINASMVKQNVIIELSVSSFMASLTQNTKNSKILEYFSQSLKTYLE